MSATARILHCFGEVDPIHARRLANRLALLGSNVDHEFAGLASGHWETVPVELRRLGALQPDFPDIGGKPWPGSLSAVARSLKRYDLVLTYGWSAINVALAYTLFGEAMGLAPLIHHEEGAKDEAAGRGFRGKWVRRIAFGRSSRIVVPTEYLEGIALSEWQQPISKVTRITPGVELPKDQVTPKPDILRSLIKRDGEYWIGIDNGALAQGTHAQVAACLADLPQNWHLVVIGEDADQDFEEKADSLDLTHRVHFLAKDDFPDIAFGLFDVFLDLTEQAVFPFAVLKAMAAGVVIAALKDSEAASLLPASSQACLAPSRSKDDLSDALWKLVEDENLRHDSGTANREFVRQNVTQDIETQAFTRLYASALQRELQL